MVHLAAIASDVPQLKHSRIMHVWTNLKRQQQGLTCGDHALLFVHMITQGDHPNKTDHASGRGLRQWSIESLLNNQLSTCPNAEADHVPIQEEDEDTESEDEIDSDGKCSRQEIAAAGDRLPRLPTSKKLRQNVVDNIQAPVRNHPHAEYAALLDKTRHSHQKLHQTNIKPCIQYLERAIIAKAEQAVAHDDNATFDQAVFDFLTFPIRMLEKPAAASNFANARAAGKKLQRQLRQKLQQQVDDRTEAKQSTQAEQIYSEETSSKQSFLTHRATEDGESESEAADEQQQEEDASKESDTENDDDDDGQSALADLRQKAA